MEKAIRKKRLELAVELQNFENEEIEILKKLPEQRTEDETDFLVEWSGFKTGAAGNNQTVEKMIAYLKGE